jgi:hypothetical protein
MLNKKLLGSVSSPPSDDNFENVALLLNGDGTNGAQNNTFIDSSTNNFTITRNGNTTQGSFSPYGNLWSNYFDGNGDWLSASSNAAFAVGTGDFAVEAWIYPQSYGTFAYVLGVAASGGLVFSKEGSNFVVRAYGVGDQLQHATLPALNTWTHVAASRSGTTLRLFYNGTQVASTTNSYNFAQGNLYVGNEDTNTAPWNGYISNLRLVKGSAVYTSAFTPSTTPLTAITNTSLLTCQSNRFVDNSSNNFALATNGTPSVQRFSPFEPTAPYSTSVIGGSGYFDGSGDYLSIARNSAFTPTGDFTYELWVYPTATPESVHGAWLGGLGESGDGSQLSWTLKILNNLTLTFYIRSSNIDHLTTATVRLNQWNYIAVSRQGTGSNNVLITLNGQNQTYSDAGSLVGNGTPKFTIGADDNGDEALLTGWVSGARFINGTGYTSIPIPTTPPTAITNTALLANFTNAGITDLAMQNNLETVGNAQVSTSVKKYGTGSLAFDGTGDYLVPNAPSSNVNLAFGSGDFTLEFWVYFNSGLGSDIVLYDGRPLSTNGAYATLYVNSSSQLSYVVSSSDRITASSTFSTSTWYHIAVARSGTSTKMFVNGTQVGSTYTDSTNYLAVARRPVIGINGFNETAAPLNGYIDDLRITRGLARYTAAFTPPASALPTF